MALTTGIAVGMATNIPPHNLGEVVNATLALIEDPDLGVEDIMTHLPGPDFPTAGIINGAAGIYAAYRTGRGRVYIRARTDVEPLGRQGREAIIVTELPFQVNKARLIEKIAELVLKHDLYVLCDEAYFDIRYEGQSKSLVSLPGMAERCVILYTFSKKFVMTGWRLGAAIGPKEIIDIIIKLNVNEESCSNHFVQYAAIEGLVGDQAETRQVLETLKERRDLTVDLLNDIEGISCIRPNATFYLFPNVTAAMQQKGLTDYEEFRRAVLTATGVSFCSRLHFGRPLEGEQNAYIRLAYSGIDKSEIEEGLAKLRAFIET